MSTNCIKCVKNPRTGLDMLCDECRPNPNQPEVRRVLVPMRWEGTILLMDHQAVAMANNQARKNQPEEWQAYIIGKMEVNGLPTESAARSAVEEALGCVSVEGVERVIREAKLITQINYCPCEECRLDFNEAISRLRAALAALPETGVGK